MVHCADGKLAWQSDEGKWKKVVVEQNRVNWCYVWVCVCVSGCVCMSLGTVKGVFIYRTQKWKRFCVLVKKVDKIYLRSCIRQILYLYTNPTLNMILHVTYRPAAALPLLTWQQLTFWHINVGGILGSLMWTLYCVSVWDCKKTKWHQQNITQYNIPN